MESTTSTEFDVSTLVGSEITLQTLLPVNFQTHGDCTLNAHFNVHSNATLSSAPKLRYFGVGTGGMYNLDDSYRSSAHRPQRTNLNIYGLMPIRCRPVDSDLSELERANYRMRVEQQINGRPYYCYYLKKLEFIGDPIYKRINPKTNAEEAYELEPANLSPVPPQISADGTIVTDTQRVIVFQQARVIIKAEEILEYINTRYQDESYAKISEIGLYTGVDTAVSGFTDEGATPITYHESLYTMLYMHKTWVGTAMTKVGMDIDSMFRIYGNGAITSE